QMAEPKQRRRDNKDEHVSNGKGGAKTSALMAHSIISTPVHSPCLQENSIVAFGNLSDERTGAARPAIPSPATDSHSPNMATTAQGVSMETEQNILKAQIPTQVNENDRLWGDEGDSTLPSPGLLDRGAEPARLSLLLGLGWLLTLLLSDQ
ncbi:hypothetical protein KUCAC02_025431, partial [Chaenocephalus aceratus]